MCALWVDKYRPKDFQKLNYHKELATRLKSLSAEDDFPHLLIYGPSGSGKKTRIMCLLRELFGSGVERIHREELTFTTPSNKKLNLTAMSSNYHMEVNPSVVGIYDRTVVMDIIKNLAQTQQLDINNEKSFRVIVLSNADNLTRDAQYALRRTMEKFVANCRLILRANSISKVSSAIKSRCLCIRIPAPTHEEIVDVLQSTIKKENLIISPEFAMKIAKASDRNLRRALLMLECCRVEKYPFTNDQPVVKQDWMMYIASMSRSILTEQSIKQLEKIGDDLRKLLEHGIPATIIMRTMLINLVENCDSQLKGRFAELAAYYEHQMQHGNKDLLHLEAFVAQAMKYYKEFMKNMFSEFMLE